jgi:fluoroquinolone resistance protein
MIHPFNLSTYYQKVLADIILAKGSIKDKEFEECCFIKLNLTDYKIEQCKFINCSFENCILSAIKPGNSSFNEVDFKECKVIGCDWTLAKKTDSLSFCNSQISYSNFRFLKLPKLKLISCIAKETDFTEADLSEGDFTATDFEGAIFFKTNLIRANFKKARNYLIDIKSNNISKAKFSYPEAMNLLKSLDITVEY